MGVRGYSLLPRSTFDPFVNSIIIKNLGFKIQLNRLKPFQYRKEITYFTIYNRGLLYKNGNHNSQTVHFSAIKFTRGNEKYELS